MVCGPETTTFLVQESGDEVIAAALAQEIIPSCDMHVSEIVKIVM